MAAPPVDRPPRKPLRLWPGVVIVTLQWFGRFLLPVLVPATLYHGVMAGMAGGVAVLLWWVFFSRAPVIERWGGALLMAGALLAARPLLHESVATGAMGMLYPMYAIPLLSLAFVAWAVATRDLPDRLRRVTMVATVAAACGVWAVVRIGGFTADLDTDFAWRWAPTPEERLLASAAGRPSPAPPQPIEVEAPPAAAPAEPATPAAGVTAGPEPPAAAGAVEPAAAAAEPRAEWPGFRGAGRDGTVSGVRIATDWAASPPVELWRRPVGPGWSSFAVAGDRIYTQEQRGEEEVVSCYAAASGEPIWQHRDRTRFWEANAGPGPRGTPTVSGGRVYSFGATGVVNALDARDGAVVWSRDAAGDTGAETPTWGFASSPLVLDDLVIVAASGRLVAYDRDSGELRWLGPEGGGTSYSSPHLATLDGVAQVLLIHQAGVVSVAPAGGTVLWEHGWRGYPIIQPSATAEGGVLMAVTADSGTRRLAVTHGADGWGAEERWTSRGLKPYFNDFVVHEGHAYGFDGGILAAIDLATGERRWKGGRFGHGQLVLLADQDLLLVVSERGELALVEAVPGGFSELARFAAVEGKTWNHPVLVGDLLLVRNAEEMVAFRLPPAG